MQHGPEVMELGMHVSTVKLNLQSLQKYQEQLGFFNWRLSKGPKSCQLITRGVALNCGWFSCFVRKRVVTARADARMKILETVKSLFPHKPVLFPGDNFFQIAACTYTRLSTCAAYQRTSHHSNLNFYAQGYVISFQEHVVPQNNVCREKFIS